MRHYDDDALTGEALARVQRAKAEADAVATATLEATPQGRAWLASHRVRAGARLAALERNVRRLRQHISPGDK